MAPAATLPLLAGLAALATFLDLSIAASSSPPRVFGLDFQKRTADVTLESGDARLRRRQKTVSTDIDNAAIAYLINITIGTPPQPFSVQLDTGSADLWIPAASSDVCLADPTDCQTLGSYDGSKSTSGQLVAPGAFQISYQDGSGVAGDYINETLAVGKTQIKGLTLGLATQASRPLGIMGIGYMADESTVQADPTSTYPNIVQQLKDQGFIGTTAYSLWLNDLNSLTGSILFGGLDTAKYTGPLVALPVQKGSNGTYKDFTVALSSFSLTDASGKNAYQKNNLALPVILDSGTTATYLPDNIATDIIKGVGAIDDGQGGLVVPCNLAGSPAKLLFAFGGNGGPSIQVSLSEFIIPVYAQDGSQPLFKDGSGAICSFGLMSSGAGDQPILLGDTFLRSAYVVYDLANNQIGLAQTKFNTTDTHVVEISETSIPGVTSTATGAAVTQSYTGHPLQTDANTKLNGAVFTGVPNKPTFSLGVPTKGAAVTFGPPRVEVTTLVTGLAIVMSMILGSSLVMMR